MQLRFFPGIMFLSKLKSALCYFGGGEKSLCANPAFEAPDLTPNQGLPGGTKTLGERVSDEFVWSRLGEPCALRILISIGPIFIVTSLYGLYIFICGTCLLIINIPLVSGNR